MYFDTRKSIKITKTAKTAYAEITSNNINCSLDVNTEHIPFYVHIQNLNIYIFNFYLTLYHESTGNGVHNNHGGTPVDNMTQ